MASLRRIPTSGARMGQRIGSPLKGLLPKQLSLVCVLSGRERAALRCSESFFDNSKVRLRCKSKTRPSGSDSWIYGRFAVLRIVSEKVFTPLLI